LLRKIAKSLGIVVGALLVLVVVGVGASSVARMQARQLATPTGPSAVARIELTTGPIDFRQIVMCIDGGGGISRKVLAAAGDTGSAKRVIKRFGVFDYFLGRPSITTTAQ